MSELIVHLVLVQLLFFVFICLCWFLDWICWTTSRQFFLEWLCRRSKRE